MKCTIIRLLKPDLMSVTIDIQDQVIIRRFSGSVCYQDVIEAWQETFEKYTDLSDYDGVVSTYQEASLSIEDGNLNEVVEFLRSSLSQLSEMRIAFVMDTPLVTNTMIIDQENHRAEVKQFKSEKQAITWIRSR